MADEELGRLIFHASAGGDEAGLAELLADRDADTVLSWADPSQGWTPLFVAVDADIDAALQEKEPLDLTCTELLLAAGAAPDAVATDGLTPVRIAERYRCTEAVRALQKRRPTTA